MAILTTTIGAYPKPDCVALPDWFTMEGGTSTATPTAGYDEALARMGDAAEARFDEGTREAIADQIEAGIDIPTDGEIRRENYIHYHCRHLEGFDFETLGEKDVRGVYMAALPTITGPVRPRDVGFLVRDWRQAQACTDRPVKITLPGPMTVGDTNLDLHYNDPKALGAALAEALNAEVLALAAAGCRWIQIDEPLFARKPDEALAYGVENLERCFQGIPDGVTACMHMCCGYPGFIDEEDYPKADPGAYGRIAEALDRSCVAAVSIEDAHRHNDLRLLERFADTTVIFGAVAIARSRLETVEEIRARLAAALNHIDAARLIAAPDCGLGLLGRDLTRQKLRNLCEAAQSL